MVAVFAVMHLLSSAAQGGGVVTECSESQLRATLSGGGVVTFACDGVISLSNPLVIAQDTTLDGRGHVIAISGERRVRVFQILAGVQLNLNHVAVADGRGNPGGGLLNDGGLVDVSDCTFSANQALGTNGIPAPGGLVTPGESAFGGAIYSTGNLRVSTTLFLSNAVIGGAGGSVGGTTAINGANGGDAMGGAIFSTGSNSLRRCVFTGNRAIGGSGGDGVTSPVPGAGGTGGLAAGGAFFGAGRADVVGCSLFSNQAVAGGGGGGYLGGTGGDASGGAIHHDDGLIWLDASVFQSNLTRAGVVGGFARTANHGSAAGGAILVRTGVVTAAACQVDLNRAEGGLGRGGGIALLAGQMRLTNTWIAGNQAIGYADQSYYGGDGRAGLGGGIYAGGLVTMVDSTLGTNGAVGGRGQAGPVGGGNGGLAGGGGIYVQGPFEAWRCTLAANTALGGQASQPSMPGGLTVGGLAQGAGMMNAGSSARLVNCTLAHNSATGGPGSIFSQTSAGGDSLGGAVFVLEGKVTLVHCTMVSNNAAGGPGGTAGSAHGGSLAVDNNGTANLTNCMATQSAAHEDVFGNYMGEHNLIGVVPLVGPLEYNGGITWTMPLLAASPAIDAGIVVQDIATDQRGSARVFGANPDIGAYERHPIPNGDFRLVSLKHHGPDWLLLGNGPELRPFRVQVSTNLLQWTNAVNNVTRASGWFDFLDTNATGVLTRFYRALAP